MSKADIELLFGVAGGGSPSGASGTKIRNQLNNIVGNINKRPLEIKIELDDKLFRQQLTDLTIFAQKQADAIEKAYAGIVFPTPPIPPVDSGDNGKKKDHKIKENSYEMYEALAKLQKYQLKAQEMVDKWTVASGGKSRFAMLRVKDEITNMQAYEASLRSGSMSAQEFAKHIKNVGTTIKQVSAEVKLNDEDTDNHLIVPKSTEMLKALTQLQTYQKQIKQMQADWTKASESGAKSADAMSELAKEGQALSVLEANLRSGTIGANDLANALEHASAVIKQTVAEVKLNGEDKSLIDFSAGSEANTKALVELNNIISKTKKNYESWTAAAKGSTASDYSSLKATIESFEKLHNDVLSGTMKFEDYQKRFSELKRDADKYSTSIRAAGKDTKSFGDNVKDLVGKFSKWLSVSQVIMKAIQTFKQMLSTVIGIDTAMTELRKVTDETEGTYDRFLENAVSRAKMLGATLTDVVSASADFAKLGKSISEASDLADAAIVYKNVGDDIDSINSAAESIISTMQAFSDENLTAMEIVDKFNATGNAYAITSTGVGDALQRSAAAMNAAGNSLDETIALITAANTIVQNPESVGTTLKTVSMFLRAAKTEAEEAGESTDGMAESMSELREEILKLTGNKVDIQIDENNFKGTYEILRDLSEVWDNLTDISQANLLEMIGGKRNANVVSALLENFEIAENALKTSADSAGSALAENEKYLDSIQGKIQKFQASWQALSSAIINTDLVKGAVDAGRILVESITWITESISGFGVAVAAVPVLHLISKIKQVSSIIDTVKNAFKSFAGGVKRYPCLNTPAIS